MATNDYIEHMKEVCTRVMYYMSKNDLFVAQALELTATNIIFDDNNTFAFKDLTFAYYNPITNSIHINAEDKFFKSVTSVKEENARMFFILFHEISHKLLLHTPRGAENDPDIWNIAADYEVHNMLYLNHELVKSSNDQLFEFTKTSMNILRDKSYGFLFSESVLDKIAEEIYCMIKNSCEVSSSESFSFNIDEEGNVVSENNNNSENGDKNNNNDKTNNKSNKSNKSTKDGGKSGEVKVSVYTLPDGKQHKTVSITWPKIDNKFQDEEKERLEKENSELRKQLWENNITASAEKAKGSLGANVQKFLKKLFKIKLDWEKILKNSLNTILQKADEFSWAKTRISTFAMDLPTLPGIDDSESGKGTLIVARDESGSMSDNDIRKAASIIVDAKEHYKKIIILKHDTDIVEEKEFDEVNDDVVKMLLTRSACGGTSHEKVFEYLTNYYKEHLYDNDNKISCFISITDGCSDIQEYQDKIPAEIPIVYLASANCLEYFNGVKGQIIPIE